MLECFWGLFQARMNRGSQDLYKNKLRRNFSCGNLKPCHNGDSLNQSLADSHKDSQKDSVCVAYLQYEYEVVDSLSSLVDKVLRTAFVTVVELNFLDDVWVSQNPQQNLVRYLRRAE